MNPHASRLSSLMFLIPLAFARLSAAPTITGAANAASNLTFNRCYFFDPVSARSARAPFSRSIRA